MDIAKAWASAPEVQAALSEFDKLSKQQRFLFEAGSEALELGNWLGCGALRPHFIASRVVRGLLCGNSAPILLTASAETRCLRIRACF
jgi:hypothetical protein